MSGNNETIHTTAPSYFTCPITGSKVYKGDKVGWNKENGYMSIAAMNLMENEETEIKTRFRITGKAKKGHGATRKFGRQRRWSYEITTIQLY